MKKTKDGKKKPGVTQEELEGLIRIREAYLSIKGSFSLLAKELQTDTDNVPLNQLLLLSHSLTQLMELLFEHYADRVEFQDEVTEEMTLHAETKKELH